MNENRRQRTAEMLRKAFEILIAHPDGLNPHAIVQEFKNDWPENDLKYLENRSVWDELIYSSIAPTKASWMFDNQGRWVVTEAGRKAFYEHTDPLKFLDEAGRHSFKGWLAVKFPGLIAAVAKTRYQTLLELRLIKRVGVKQLTRELLGKTTSWQEALPVQKPRRYQIPDIELKSTDELESYLHSQGVKYMYGGHTVYLPPDAWEQTAFAGVRQNYPPTAGLKIVKNPGGIDQSNYIHTSHHSISKLHKKITHSHSHLTLVSNALYGYGVGPRLYDLCELQTGKEVWTANVIEHVEGRTPTVPETNAGLDKIRELEAKRVLRVTIPDGYNDEDFLPPDCNGNAIVGLDGVWKYIDHQNFLLVDYENYLKQTALESAEDSHYGDVSLIRGKRYLYQAVPGVAVPGKRDPQRRMESLDRMMARTGVSVEGKLVMDVGCNVGMMMAQYLRRGAKWCHGWDLANVTPNTERLLFSIGCTRFSLTGGNIAENPTPENDLPKFLHPHLNGCAISFLSVHRWIEWPQMFGRIPWSYMIFEGHEGDSKAFNEESFARLRKITNFEVADYTEAQDGDSEPRAIAILIRKP
jgi:hypothetical protein